MVYNVMDVARYVINYCNKNKYEISNLKLQKLLYFIQADYLSDREGFPCFREEIQAWNFGPVVPEVYYEFKSYGGGYIPYIDTYLYIDYKNIGFHRRKFDETVICEEDRKHINNIIDGLSPYSTTTLLKLTLNQSPWMKAYCRGEGTVIKREDIKEFFES